MSEQEPIGQPSRTPEMKPLQNTRMTDGPERTPFHVVPDPGSRGGWNVYATHKPQEPQQHFDLREEAVAFAERLALQEGTGFVVETHEAPMQGRMAFSP